MNDRLLLFISLGVSVVLGIIKGIVAFFTGSVAITASMIDSIMDSASTIVNIFFYNTSSLPADYEHPFGHGKFEALASILQGFFIGGTGFFVLYSSLVAWGNPIPLEYEEWGIGVMIIAILAPFFLSAFLKKNASKYSLILFAEEEHFASDALLNASVLVGILSSFFFHTSHIDALVGIIAALLIVWRAFELLKLSISVLLDEKLPEEIEEDIKTILSQNPDLQGWHELRTRRSGSELHADIHLEFTENILLKDAHKVADEIETQLLKKYPTMHLLTHFDIICPK